MKIRKGTIITFGIMLAMILTFITLSIIQKNRPQKAENQLMSIIPGEVKSLRLISNFSNEIITLKAQHDTRTGVWTVSGGRIGDKKNEKSYVGDADALNQYLDNLNLIRYEKDSVYTVNNEDQWETYGLRKPLLELDILLKNGDEKRIAFGEKIFDKDFYYTRLNDENTVYYVNQSHMNKIKTTLFLIRNKNIFHRPIEQITQIYFKYDKESYVLHWDKDELMWKFTQPTEVSLEPRSEMLTRFLQSINTIKSEEFLPSTLPLDVGLTPYQKKFEIMYRDNESITLDIGTLSEQDNTYYCRFPETDEVCKISKYAINNIADDLNRLLVLQPESEEKPWSESNIGGGAKMIKFKD